jgi:hypothetical protein
MARAPGARSGYQVRPREGTGNPHWAASIGFTSSFASILASFFGGVEHLAEL